MEVKPGLRGQKVRERLQVVLAWKLNHPLAAPAETPRAGLMLGAETPSIGASASSSRKRTAAEGGDETCDSHGR